LAVAIIKSHTVIFFGGVPGFSKKRDCLESEFILSLTPVGERKRRILVWMGINMAWSAASPAKLALSSFERHEA
jgi:hypothetical protein